MYCAVLLLADGSYDREFIDFLPTERYIRALEDEHSMYVLNPNRSAYGESVRKPATIINVFKLGDDYE
jgi:hypothetical protein